MEAINFLQELQKVLIDGAQQLQNTASTTGVGTTEPKGVITAIVGTASVVNSAGADVFAKADVYNGKDLPVGHEAHKGGRPPPDLAAPPRQRRNDQPLRAMRYRPIAVGDSEGVSRC